MGYTHVRGLPGREQAPVQHEYANKGEEGHASEAHPGLACALLEDRSSESVSA
jgi:hypothetical protein